MQYGPCSYYTVSITMEHPYSRLELQRRLASSDVCSNPGSDHAKSALERARGMHDSCTASPPTRTGFNRARVATAVLRHLDVSHRTRPPQGTQSIPKQAMRNIDCVGMSRSAPSRSSLLQAQQLQRQMSMESCARAPAHQRFCGKLPFSER